ncbi:MAG: DNA repair protein RecO [Deltaproteobacteria bacterium]|nr:DNA repair protein RecO [Deltaproteobacteria bacterium]MBI3295701.1 DNA repair protein RecO [Deltaproteobacteria bacterium]
MALTRAIVLSSEVFGEADRYIQFLTRDWGVISTLAKAARKSKRRYVGGLDIFCHSEINVRGDIPNRAYLVELTVLNSFTKLRDDLDKILIAGQLVQWVRKLADVATPIPQIYSLLGQTLALLEAQSDPARLSLLGLVFRLKLISHLGFHPRTEACARCNQEGELAIFDLGSGGLICTECKPTSDHWELYPEERQFITHAKDLRLTRFEEVQFSEKPTQRMLHLITQFTSFHTHAKLPV